MSTYSKDIEGLRALSSQFRGKRAQTPQPPAGAQISRQADQQAAQTQQETDPKRPFGIQRLDGMYVDAVRRLAKAGGQGSHGLDPIKDARDAVQYYWDSVRQSTLLNASQPKGKSPLDVGQTRFDKRMKELEMTYASYGGDYGTLKGMLTESGYKTRAQIEAEDAAAYQARFGVERNPDNPWAQWAQENGKDAEKRDAYIQFYENLPQYVQGVIVGKPWGTDLMDEKTRGVWQDFIDRADGNWLDEMLNRSALRQEDMEKLAAYGGEQARYIRDAEAWAEESRQAQANPWMEWAGQNRDKRDQYIDFYEHLPENVRRVLAGEISGNDLMMDPKYEEWQDFINRANENWLDEMLNGDTLRQEDEEKLAAFGKTQADYLRDTESVYQRVPENSDWQDHLLTQLRGTPEGAREWAEEARGTDREQEAKANLWFVERKAKYDELENRPDFAEKSRIDPQDEFGGQLRGKDGKTWIMPDPDKTPLNGGKIITNMTDQEVARYAYLMNTEGRDAANEYLEYLQYELDKRANEASAQQMRDLANSGWAGAVGASALSVPLSLMRGLGAADIALQNLNNQWGEYKPINYHSMYQNPGGMADAAREEVMGLVDWEMNILGQNVDLFDFLYGTTMSGVDSLAAGAAGPWTGAVLLGTGAAQSTMMDAKERNGNDRQVLLSGILAGVFETLFEHVSIGHFYDEAAKIGTGSFKDGVINILAQAGINFTEEAMTEIADIAADQFIMGEKSGHAKKYQEYVDLGMTEEEARARVAEDIVRQVAEAGAGGALMGGFFGEISNISANANARSSNRQAGQSIITQNTTAALKEIGMSFPKGSSARAMAEAFDPKTAKARDVGKFYRELHRLMPHQMQGTLEARMSADIADRLADTAAGGNAEAALGITKLVAGEQLTEGEYQAIAASDQAMDVLRELTAGPAEERAAADTESKESAPEEVTLEPMPVEEAEEAAAPAEGAEAMAASGADEGTVADAAKAAAPAEAVALEAAEAESTEAAPGGEAAADSAPEAEAARSATPPSARVTVKETGESAQVKSAKIDDDGEMRVSLSDGTEKDAGSLDMTDAQRTILREGASMPAIGQEAMMKNFEEAGDVKDYVRGFQRVFDAASRGVSAGKIKSMYGDLLTPAQRIAAVQAGQAEYQRAQRSAEANTQKAAKESGFRALAAAKEGEAGLFFARVTSAVRDTLTSTQLKLIDAYARETGMQVRVYDTLGEENGNYQAGSNIVNVALDADDNALTRTVSHEGFHYIEQWNKEGAAELKKFVLDQLRGMAGYDLQGRVRAMQEQYKNAVGQELTEDAALSEIAAESVLDVIGTEENIRALTKQSRTLAEKIGEWIRKAADAIRRLVSNYAQHSPETQALMDRADYLEEVGRRYGEAIAQANENRLAAQTGMNESIRQDADIQAYRVGMENAVSREDARAELDGLVGALFARTQREWIAGHMEEYEAGLRKFRTALEEYAGGMGRTALSVALERQGLNAPSQDMNAVLSYASRQTAEAEKKHAIKRATTKNGNEIAYVQADRQVIHGDDAKEWGKQIEDYINQEIRKGKDVTVYTDQGVPLTITKETAGKGAYWNTYEDRTPYSKDDLSLKYRIEAHIDEAAQVSQGKGGRVADRKSHGFAQSGFNYRRAYFMDFDGKYYTFKISVGTTGKVNTVYNVSQIKEAGVQIELKGSRPQLGNSQMGRSVSLTSENSILETEGDVNRKFNLKNDSRYNLRQDAEERRTAQTMEGMAADAELYAQAMTDEDTKAAAQLMTRLYQATTQGADAPLQKGAWKTRLSDVAGKMLEETGSAYGKRRLMQELARLYSAMEEKGYNTGELLTYARQIAQGVLEKAPGVLVEMDEGTREVLRILKDSRFYLTDDQKSEIRGTYGSVADYMRKNFGKMGIRAQAKNGTGGARVSLAEVWQNDLHPIMPGTFSLDTIEADMPGILDAYLETAGQKKFGGSFGANIGAYATNMALNAMLDFYDVPGALEGKQAIREEFRAKVNKIAEEYQEKYRNRIEKTQERKAETEKRQKLRGQITRAVRAINTLNVRASDNRHVPEEMRAAALRAVKPFLDNSGVFSRAEMDKLGYEYSLLEKRMGELRGFDEDILGNIQELSEKLDGRRLSQLKTEELQQLADVTGNLHKMILDANEARIAGRQTTIDAISAQLKADMREKKDASRNRIIEMMRKLSYKETTAIYYGDRVGGVLKEMIGDLFRGQNKWAFTMDAAKKRADKIFDDYKVNKWINDRNHLRFTTDRGETIELNRKEALTLYATWKRETTNKLQNANHLRIGGFMYERGTKYAGVDTMHPHPLTENDMAQIRTYLGKEQMAFADEMVQYLSQDMAAIGNEVSMALYGYEKFKEGYYFPYESDRRYLVNGLTQTGEVQKQPSGMGSAKATVKNASNPVTLRGFLDVWAGHVNEMALYSAFAESIDTMNRVLNDKASGGVRVNALTGAEDIISPESNWLELERALGADGVNYLKTLARDVSGGVRADERGMMAKGLSAFKKASVAGNLSVVLQQPTAIARAMMMVSPRYILSQTPLNIKKLRQNIQTMYKYSGVALIKDMGRFDTGTGKGAVAWLQDSVKDESRVRRMLDKVDEWTGVGAEKADEWTWGLLWGAIESEIEHTRTDLTPGTEAFHRAVAERFEDVVNHTQVYDSVLSKSEWMRSQSTMDKMVTSFMAEPTLTMNMLQDAMLNSKNPGGKKRVARAAGAFLVNSLLTALAKSIVTATRRRDDEERTWIEKYLAESTGNFLEDISPFGIVGNIPWARDVVSIFEGYDVERSDMDAVTQVYNAWKILSNENKSLEDKIQAVTGAVGNITGVPVKNLWRDGEAIIRNLFAGGSAPISETTGRDIKYSVLDNLSLGPISLWESSNKAYYARMERALLEGDEGQYQELLEYMTGANQVKEKSVESGVKTEIKESLEKGLVSDERAMAVLQKYFGMDGDEAFFQVEKWAQEAKNSENEEYSYKKYGEVFELVKDGQDIRDASKKLTDHGVTEKSVASAIKGQIKEWYSTGEMSQQQATEKLKKYCGITDSGELHWLFDEWDYKAAKGEEDENYSRYVDVYDAVKRGRDIKTAMKEMTDNGYTEKDVMGRIKGKVGEWYKAGEMTKSTAAQKLKQYSGITDENDLYWLFEQWDYEKRTAGNKNAPAYGKYDAFYKALEGGGAALRTEVQRYTAHGVDQETIARQITSQYKQQYIQLYRTNKAAAANLKARILTAYEMLGYDRNKKNKDIEKWLK